VHTSIVVYSFSQASVVSLAFIKLKIFYPSTNPWALVIMALQISLIKTTNLGGVL